MKKILVSCMLATIVAPFANACDAPRMTLDTVSFQVSAKQWISTQTALLSVNVNATLTNADLVGARAQIMNQLNKIAVGQWHITQFDRSQDSSGLDKLFVEAQLRVLQSALTDVYKNAKLISKPGVTYTIDSIEFKPDLDDIQKAKTQLRDNLYRLVNNEIIRLNNVYATQHYSVNRVDVLEGENARPMPMGAKPRMNTTMMATVAQAEPISVSNELVMTAYVQAASNRTDGGPAASAKP